MLTAGMRVVATSALAIPAFFLIIVAWPRFQEGLTHDAAMPVPVFMIEQHPLPKSLYGGAAAILAGADAADGDQAIAGAEAAMYAGQSGASQVDRIAQGLSHMPGYVRGWTLLAAAGSAARPDLARKSLSLALQLAPYEYWIGGYRAQLAARMWGDLDADTRETARNQVRLLWREPIMRPALAPLSTSPAGVSIIREAFSDTQGELLDVNRWLIQHHTPASPQ
jgi:hypothetical protein